MWQRRRSLEEEDSETTPPIVIKPDYTPVAGKTTTIHPKKMANLEEIQSQLQQLSMKLQVSEHRQKESEDKIKNLTDNLNRFQSIDTPIPYKNIETKLASGDQIQLDSYKAIPEFSGDQKQYRSWREQVIRRMSLIEEFESHPKYEAALGIIRAKITNTASDILINNNTPYNINAMIDRLGFSYADQRPLYVVEAEMTSIKQGSKNLQDYYDAINQALNMVITKIVMTYKYADEQRSLTEQTQQKAVRTFIVGLKNAVTRNILYGQSPKSLAAAFAIAQTVFYDNQYLQLDQNRELQRCQDRFLTRIQQNSPPKFSLNFNYNKPPQVSQPKEYRKPEPMEVDNSNRFRQSTNWRQPNQQVNIQANAQKRDYDSSRRQLNQPPKIQRINQLQDNELTQSTGECKHNEAAEYIPDDLISNSSQVSQVSDNASTFLDA